MNVKVPRTEVISSNCSTSLLNTAQPVASKVIDI